MRPKPRPALGLTRASALILAYYLAAIVGIGLGVWAAP